MWKHHYESTGPKDNILHNQAQFWGRRDLHYHQFLKSGENTLNLKLCDLLIQSLIQLQAYHPGDYLQRLIHSFLEWLDESDAAVVDNRLGSGCFVDQSFPVVIYLLLKYHRRPEQGLIANTNLGGNNAARGAVLGALLGAANGFEALPKRWVDGLRHSPQEIEAFG
jgi:hypothetical protein